MFLTPTACQQCGRATWPRSDGQQLCHKCHKEQNPEFYGDLSYKIELSALETIVTVKEQHKSE